MAEVLAVYAADKLASAAPYVIAPLEELTYVVTEQDASPEEFEGFCSGRQEGGGEPESSVATMATLGVRSRSLKRSLALRFPLNDAV